MNKSDFDNFFYDYLPDKSSYVYELVSYSVDGGSRVRPLLLLNTVLAINGVIDDNVKRLACALECVHAYSLVHDDLPCMDNDDCRRGKLTVHKKFGEAKAVLVGDALLNYSAEILFNGTNLNNYFNACKVIFDASSSLSGMILGQFYDLFDRPSSLQDVEKIDLLKTSALIRAGIIAGATYCGIGEKEITVFSSLGDSLGLAYQFADDLSDMGEEGNSAVNVFGIEETRCLCIDYCDKCISLVGSLPYDLSFILELVSKLREKALSV